MNGTMLFYMESFWDMYGDTYTWNILGTKITFTRDASNIKHILVGHWLEYNAVQGIRNVMFEHLAPGTIAATEGKEWEENRSKWRHYLGHLGQLFDMPFLETSFQKFVHHIDSGENVDVQPLFLDLTTDISNNLILGETTNCIDVKNQSKEGKAYVEALTRANPVTALRGFLGPVEKFIPKRGYKADCAMIKGYIAHIIEKKLSARPEEAVPRQQTLLDRLLDLNEDPQTLNHSATSMVMANESMSRPLSHTLWLLSRHPVIYEKLRKEILDVIGYQKPTYDQLNKFKYLRNILSESVRLLPPDPITMRIANTDNWLPSGGGSEGKDSLLVRKGQRVVISIFGSHRNPANFGEDASEFRPDRWNELNIDTPGYLPFSMGPRICTGSE
ncbi:hypothetical protein N0V90_000424 [Kalmusia sp. IMI 367209]|nr:hypothetical protein N0V90_000424 [Kalmusia sp. IMI 367209]